MKKRRVNSITKAKKNLKGKKLAKVFNKVVKKIRKC